MNVRHLVPIGVLLAAIAAGAQAQSSARSVRAGVFTAKQAERGAKVFEPRCATCHAAGDFTGRYLAPWAGQTTDKLFETIRATMPQDEPGSLSREQYADVLAFIFSRNGFAAGEREMASAPETLRAIVIELPPGK